MDKKKTYKERKKRKTSKLRKARESIKFFMDLHDKGLEQIYLSPLTQKFLDCRIGDEITADRRWIFIKKEKIEDNLFLHDNSSEFLPIKNLIEIYPEPEMLIGSFSHIQDNITDFFLCTTVAVKEEILQVIETEKQNIYERIWNLLNLTPGYWTDLGSQNEVDDGLIKKFRTFYEIILETEYPIPYHRSIFRMCFAEDIPNSYADSGSRGLPYNIVLRKRVDVGTQCKELSEDKALQCTVAASRNKYVQYAWHYEVLQLNEETLEHMKIFFRSKTNVLYETLLVNFNINLFVDDYKRLAIHDTGFSFKDPIELRSFQDVILCKHKKVSCVSWNAFISGIIAVAYTVTPLNYVGKRPPMHNDAEDTVFEQHLILLWSYRNNVRPILYIHADRAVTSLSFCPYDPDILVGGYSNGQMVVWDITGRIKAIESREVLTQLEQHHRSIISQQSSWIKSSFGIDHVFPVVTSRLACGHKSAVTSIIWIPPTHYITHNGRYEKCISSEEHMQFLTVSLDGSAILVWDLKIQKEQMEKTVWKKRTQRLSKLPDALTITQSPLKKLQKYFIPHYMLHVKDPITGEKQPLTNILSGNRNYKYVAVNPSTLNSLEARTFFKERGLLTPFISDQKLIITTALGNLKIVKWDGSAYNQGLSINAEPCNLTRMANVHDGPITNCELNSLLDGILLTIGGNVFAVWKLEALKVPVFWRKSDTRYISGMWSFRQPLTLFVTRSDSLVEIWNLLEKSNEPIRCFKYKGNRLVSLFNDPLRLHVRKETYITADVVGAMKIFHLPCGILRQNDSCIDEAITFINQIINIKSYTQQLKQKYAPLQEKVIPPVIRDDRRTLMVPAMEIATAEQKSTKVVDEVQKGNVVQRAINKWQRRLVHHMYKTLIEKKKLNLEELQNDRLPFQLVMDEKAKKQKKIDDQISSREEDFKKIKDVLLVPVESYKIRRKLSVSIPKTMTEILKRTYYESFAQIEAEALEQINSSRFQFTLNWNQFLSQTTFSN